MRLVNCGAPDVFCVYLHRTPLIFVNDASAIVKGAHALLHYEASKAARDANRTAALRGQGSCTPLFGSDWSLDEYPFASTKEGGLRAQVLCVPNGEQITQSIDLNSFYRLELNYGNWAAFYVLPVPY